MKKYANSVGGNMKHIQLTPKCRYNIFRKIKLKIYCKVALEEACKRYKIEVDILEVLPNHVHMLADVPRTMSDAKAMQLLKGFSSYLLFRLCPDLRKRYPKGHLWGEGYHCEGVGSSDYEKTFNYIKNQRLHHA